MKNFSHLTSIMFIMFCLLNVIQATLTVKNLKDLEQNPDQRLMNISYSSANFGFVPFGKTMTSHLAQSPHISDECDTDDNISLDEASKIENSFLLIPRGNCDFVFKAIHAQKLKAKLVIIMDNQIHKGLVIMKDNGYGYKVKIPSIFINQEDGQRLLNLLQRAQDQKVLMKIVFQNVKTQKVDLIFYLKSGEKQEGRQSYKIIREFKKYYYKIQQFINISVVYYNQKTIVCKPKDCFGKNCSYCALNVFHEDSANGQDLLRQEIRQTIIFNQFRNKWWDFMKKVDEQCGRINELSECSKKIEKLLQIDGNKVENILNKEVESDFKILYNHQTQLKTSGIKNFPSITINNNKMKGLLSAKFIFDDICNTLIHPPSECNIFEQNSSRITEEKSSNIWWIVLLSIASGLLIFGLIFCAYRRYMQKKMKQQMQSRVGDMVGKYIQFYSERNEKNKN